MCLKLFWWSEQTGKRCLELLSYYILQHYCHKVSSLFLKFGHTIAECSSQLLYLMLSSHASLFHSCQHMMYKGLQYLMSMWWYVRLEFHFCLKDLWLCCNVVNTVKIVERYWYCLYGFNNGEIDRKGVPKKTQVFAAVTIKKYAAAVNCQVFTEPFIYNIWFCK
jgi:hypothetical protein